MPATKGEPATPSLEEKVVYFICLHRDGSLWFRGIHLSFCQFLFLYVSKPSSLWFFFLIHQSGLFLSRGIILKLQFFSSALLSVLRVFVSLSNGANVSEKMLIY